MITLLTILLSSAIAYGVIGIIWTAPWFKRENTTKQPAPAAWGWAWIVDLVKVLKTCEDRGYFPWFVKAQLCLLLVAAFSGLGMITMKVK